MDENALKTVHFSNFDSLVRYGSVFYSGAESEATIFSSQKSDKNNQETRFQNILQHNK